MAGAHKALLWLSGAVKLGQLLPRQNVLVREKAWVLSAEKQCASNTTATAPKCPHLSASGGAGASGKALSAMLRPPAATPARA